MDQIDLQSNKMENYLFEEKILNFTHSILPEIIGSSLEIEVSLEAFGPSRNEGICYESCYLSEFKRVKKFKFLFCLDGYTQLKLLPLIVGKNTKKYHNNITSENFFSDFYKNIFHLFLGEVYLEKFTENLNFRNFSHKIIPIDLNNEKQFISIFFLKDRKNTKYLGRLYNIILFEK